MLESKLQMDPRCTIENSIKHINLVAVRSYRLFVYRAFMVLIPFVFVIFEWFSDSCVKRRLVYRKVHSIGEATHVLIKNTNGLTEVVPLSHETLYFGPNIERLFYTFVYHHIRYLYHDNEGRFISLKHYFTAGQSIHSFCDRFRKGRFSWEAGKLLSTFGKNQLVVEKQSFMRFLYIELSTPLSIFQICTYAILLIRSMYLYTSILLFMFVKSVLNEAWARMKLQSELIDISDYKTKAIVIRRNLDGSFNKAVVGFTKLVPGDVVEISQDITLPADMLLVHGSCIVDENMLTGENVPVIKTPVYSQNNLAAIEEVSHQHVLFAGSKCMYTRTNITGCVLAIVLNTGFNSSKGDLVRSLIFPRQMRFRFYRDASVLLLFLFCGAIGGIVFYVVYQHNMLTEVNWTFKSTLFRCLSIFFSIVKPTIPLCLYVSLNRTKANLKKKDIYSVNKFKINECGKVTLVGFDKTGTLTEHEVKTAGFVVNSEVDRRESDFSIHDAVVFKSWFTKGLALQSEYKGPRSTVKRDLKDSFVLNELPTRSSMGFRDTSLVYKPFELADEFDIKCDQSQVAVKFELSELQTADEVHNDRNMTNQFFLNYMIGCSVCNTLVKVDGETLGLQLEKEMVENSLYEMAYVPKRMDKLGQKYVLKERYAETYKDKVPGEMKLRRIMDFSAASPFMSAVVKIDTRYFVYSKGAPEEIEQRCKPDSIPANYYFELYRLAKQGYRVIALGFRELDKETTKADRDEVEQQLVFLGFYVFDNPLKENTVATITTLRNNSIKCVLISGDMNFTCISVALSSGFIDPGCRVITCHKIKTEEGGIDFVWYEHESEEFSKGSKSHVNSVILSWEQVFNYRGRFLLAMDAKVLVALLEVIRQRYDALEQLNLFNYLAHHITIFSRANTANKKIIAEFLKTNYDKFNFFGYVGDGANDYEALKLADISLALGSFDMSIAAPFITKRVDIGQIVPLLEEGKAAMHNGLQNFRFILFFSLNSLLCNMILSTKYIWLNTMQSIFLDIFVFSLLGPMLSNIRPKRLCPAVPKSRIFNKETTVSLMLQASLSIMVLIISSWYYTTEKGYVRPIEIIGSEAKESGSVNVDDYSFFDNHFMFVLIGVADITFFVVSNARSEFRASIFRHFTICAYCLLLLGFIGFCSYIQYFNSNVVTNLIRGLFLIPDYLHVPYLYLGTFAGTVSSIIVTNWVVMKVDEKHKTKRRQTVLYD